MATTPRTAEPRPAEAPATTGVRLSEAMPPELVTLYKLNPEGIARNILDASLGVRVPNNVRSLEMLDAWATNTIPELKTMTAEAFRSSKYWVGLARNYNTNPRFRGPRIPVTPVRRAPVFSATIYVRGHFYRNVVERCDIDNSWNVDIPLDVAQEGETAIEDFIRDAIHDELYEMDIYETENIDYGCAEDGEVDEWRLEDDDIEDIVTWGEDE